LAVALVAAREVRPLLLDRAAADQPLRPPHLARELAAFALCVWGTNWLSNLFLQVDRYMLLHTSGLRAEEAIAWVGNYHSANVLPLVLVGFGAAVSTTLLPYLSGAWESGSTAAAGAQLRLALKSWGLAAAAVGVGILLVAPLLFRFGFHEKFLAGLAILPWTVASACWFSLARLAQKYLWCAERPGDALPAWVIGLSVNALLNLVLVPLWGLLGMAIATACGHLTALLLVLACCRRAGLELDLGVALAALLPLAMCGGAATAAAATLAMALLAWRTRLLLCRSERVQLRRWWQSCREVLFAGFNWVAG
jgi:PST family polysaccharide transporter